MLTNADLVGGVHGIAEVDLVHPVLGSSAFAAKGIYVLHVEAHFGQQQVHFIGIEVLVEAGIQSQGEGSALKAGII